MIEQNRKRPIDVESKQTVAKGDGHGKMGERENNLKHLNNFLKPVYLKKRGFCHINVLCQIHDACRC